MHSTDIDKKSAKAEIVIRMTASKTFRYMTSMLNNVCFDKFAGFAKKN